MEISYIHLVRWLGGLLSVFMIEAGDLPSNTHIIKAVRHSSMHVHDVVDESLVYYPHHDSA